MKVRKASLDQLAIVPKIHFGNVKFIKQSKYLRTGDNGNGVSPAPGELTPSSSSHIRKARSIDTYRQAKDSQD